MHPFRLPVAFRLERVLPWWERSLVPSRAHAPSYSAYLSLTKPRLTSMAALAAVLSYFVAQPSARPEVLAGLVLGTLLSAFGAAALNQWAERLLDARMVRTSHRPLPAGAISPAGALAFGLILVAFGCGILWLTVNALAAFLALTAAVLYWLVYTPLKRRTYWCTEAGAVAGAIPPLIGWAAAEGTLAPLAWVLFAILYLWQMPHFHPIAWRYRRDYARAGFQMLALADPNARRAGNHSIAYAMVLTFVAMLPVGMGLVSPLFLLPAAGLSAVYSVLAVKFRFSPDRDAAAGRLFRFSLLYLPVLLGSLILARWAL